MDELSELNEAGPKPIQEVMFQWIHHQFWQQGVHPLSSFLQTLMRTFRRIESGWTDRPAMLILYLRQSVWTRI